jgi:hypothetical protein
VQSFNNCINSVPIVLNEDYQAINLTECTGRVMTVQEKGGLNATPISERHLIPLY